VKKIISIIREYFTPSCLALVIIAMFLLSLSGMEKSGGMTQLEARIGKTLSRMEGAGQVSVVIRTVMPSGQSKGLSVYSSAGEIPCGALAVAEGGSDPLVRKKMTDALCALLGLHASQVDVIGMDGGG